VFYNPSALQEKAEKHGLPLLQLLYGVFLHELAHFTACPGSAETWLELLREVQEEVGDWDLAARLLELYTELWDELFLFERGYRQTTMISLTLARGELRSPPTLMDLARKALALKLGKGDLFPRFHPWVEEAVERLAELDYVHPPDRKAEAREFARIFKELLRKATDKGAEGSMDTRASHVSGDFIPPGLEGALESLKTKLTPEEIRELAEALVRLGADEEGVVIALSPWEKYLELSREYELELPPSRNPLYGELFPHSKAPWTPDTPIHDLDWLANLTPGILPGVTKRKVRYSPEEEAPPWALIVVDSSGSMVDPCRNDSPAVLGAFIVAKAFLKGGGRVCALNTSNISISTLFLGNEEAETIYKVLAAWQGGGTFLRPAVLEHLLEEAEGHELRAFVFTDGGLVTASFWEGIIFLSKSSIKTHLFCVEGLPKKARDSLEGLGIEVSYIGGLEDVPEVLREILERSGI